MLGPLGLVDLDDPPLTLADEAIELAEDYMRVPTGLRAREPLILTPEQVELLIEWYRVTPNGREFVWRRLILVGPKGWSKSPLGALDTFFHLVGACVPDGLDAHGRAVGRPHPAPWTQIAGTSEDNTDNLYAQFHAALNESRALDDFGIDLGLTRTVLEGRAGKVEPVTASFMSRTGNPISDLKREETWLWNRTNGGHALAAATNQNARKMRARVMDLTNMWIPGSDSTLERAVKAHRQGRSARTLLVVIGDGLESVEDIYDDAVVTERMEQLYGSHLTVHGGWIDLTEYLDDRPPGDTTEAQWRRLYLNEETGDDDDVFDVAAFAQMIDADARLTEGETIALGFDGSDTGDAAALYAVRWPDWTVFELGVWEHEVDPLTGVRRRDWKLNRAEVRARIRWALESFRVVRGYADPAHWQTDIDEFSEEFGEAFMRFPHHSATRIGPAAERFTTMFDERTLRFAPSEQNYLLVHARNARREPVGPLTSKWFRPVRRVQGQPIDAYSAAISAVHALGDALAEGKVAEEMPLEPTFIRT